MDIASILSRSLSDYKKNPTVILPHVIEYVLDIAMLFLFVILFALSVMAYIPSLASGDFSFLFSGNIPFFLIAFLVFGMFLLGLLFTLFSASARAAIISMTQDFYGGKRTTLKTGWEGAKEFGLAVFLYNLLLGIVLFLLLVLVVMPLAVGSAIIGVFTFFLAVLLFLIVYLFTLFTPQEIVVNKKGVLDGVKESYRFVEGNLIPVLIYVGVTIVASIALMILSFLISLLAILSPSSTLNLAINIFQYLFSFIAGLLIAPYFEIVKTYMVMEV